MDLYPTEILVTPTPAIAVISDNSQVADALATLLRGRNSGTTSVRVRFETFPLSHPFPDKRRSHATEYETYVPEGLLRAGWLTKHHSRLASSVVLVLRVPEDCPDWPAAEAGIIAAVAATRPAMSHGAEILVVIAGTAVSTAAAQR